MTSAIDFKPIATNAAIYALAVFNGLVLAFAYVFAR